MDHARWYFPEKQKKLAVYPFEIQVRHALYDGALKDSHKI